MPDIKKYLPRERFAISQAIENYTAQHSNFDTTRPYISLSHASLPAEEIIKIYRNGFEDSHQGRLRCYKGYQMERDLMDRIKKVFPEEVTTGIEISAFDGKVLGHPDFTFLGYPADCKSVPLDEHLPAFNKLPRKVYYQMQGYMKYSNKDAALVIYESRETGKIVHYWLRENTGVQSEIHVKLTSVVTTLF